MKLKRNKDIKNKYKLTPRVLETYIVGDRTEVCEPLFWRNNVINAWCISKEIGGDEFWIGIYDDIIYNEDSLPVGQFRFDFYSYGGMCKYEFKKFFNLSEIENEDDLRIQEAFIEKINLLIDKGIIVQPRGEK